jgi:hypothetical protein
MDTALPPELITANGRLKRQLALTQFQHVINNHYINEHDFNEHDFNEHDINNHNEPITDITLRTTRGTTPRTTR